MGWRGPKPTLTDGDRLVIATQVAEALRQLERTFLEPRIKDPIVAARAVWFDDEHPVTPDDLSALTHHEAQLLNALRENLHGRVAPDQLEDLQRVVTERNASRRCGPLDEGDDAIADLVGQRRALIARGGGRLHAVRHVRHYRALGAVFQRVAAESTARLGKTVSERMVRGCWEELGSIVAPGRDGRRGKRGRNSG